MKFSWFGYDLTLQPTPSTKLSHLSLSTKRSKQFVESSLPSHDIQEEFLSRVRTFFGDEGLEKLKNSFVIVVGLGGVGSHCTNMLARSGIRRLRVIDFDQVTLSSLNRHAVANLSDVGISKAEAMKRRLNEIVPWCEVEAVSEMFLASSANSLLSGNPAYVIDCIDDVNTKAELIAYCIHHQLPILTSLGAGGKADPTRLRIAPLSDCINDPLAQKLKWKLKKHQVIAEDVMCVFSIEKPVCELLPLSEEQKNSPQDFGVVDYLRLRIIPVLGTSPSIFGQAMASYILTRIGGKEYEPEACERLSRNLKLKLKQLLKNNEKRLVGTDKDLNIDDDDIEFVVQQVWKSRCPITQKKFGGHVVLTLARWDINEEVTPYNLVLVMQNEAQKLLEHGNKIFNEEVRARVNARLAWAKSVSEDSWDPKIDKTEEGKEMNRKKIEESLLSESNEYLRTIKQFLYNNGAPLVAILVLPIVWKYWMRRK